jgi:tRNA dimethylallyltransferase
MIPIITIEGPTASGKSALAMALAQELDTEIISADSRQVYRYLNIGTAKPSTAELSLVKHHLIDVINPDESFNAGAFRDNASKIIKRLHNQGKIPIVCGGTGLYIKSLLEGLFEIDISDKTVKERLIAECEAQGLDYLYTLLKDCDAQAASNISSNDKQRILRALEVYQSTGIPISEHWKRQESKQEYIPYKIFINEDRKDLYNRIDKRVTTMIEVGLIDEIKSVIKKGYKWENPGFNSVGYKEFKHYIDNELSLEECVATAQQHTRNYAKRQLTWYRKCNFNLSEAHYSIIISNVVKMITAFFKT